MNEKYADGISSVMKNGFWFVDIPRTSSSSIRIELGKQFGEAYGKSNLLEQKYSMNQIFPDHLPAKEMINILGEDNWKKIITFSIVRNPWSRIFSLYNYRKEKKNIPVEWTFSDYVKKLERAEPFDTFFKYHGFRFGSSDFLTNERGEILVNHVLKYEKRCEDLKSLSNILGFELSGKIKTQYSICKDYNYSHYYNWKTKRIIERLYSMDIELFHYSFI
jgi:hypothetical protein